MKNVIETFKDHIATIIIRKRSLLTKYPIFMNNRYRQTLSNNILLNITWLRTLHPSNQIPCGGHFENKSYSIEQRCDG